MSIESKLSKTTKASEKLEEEFIKELEEAFVKAGKAIQGRMKTALKKFNVDGKFNIEQMKKFDRLEKLLKNIDSEVAIIQRGKIKSIKKYLTSVYELNYYSMGWALETEGQIGLSYSVLNKTQVSNSMLTPLDKIALKNNAILTRKRMRKTITQSIIKGDSISMMAKGIKKSLTINANNAVRIARTETTGIMGRSRMDSMEHAAKTGLVMRKEWVATNDDRTRESHVDIDGERVAMDKPFSNGLDFPGDQAGDAEEVINCRCTMVTEIAGYPNPESTREAADGGVIKKQDLEGWFNDRVKNV